MKKRTSTIIGALVVLCLATSCFVGSTFAKYTSTGTGSATTSIAKWSFNVGNKNITKTDEANFSTAIDQTVTEYNSENADTEVVEDKMAPGTSGKYTFTLTNTSEVDAKVTFSIDYALYDGEAVFTNVACPIKSLTVKNGDATLEPINNDNTYTVDLDYQGGTTNTATITVEWSWPIDEAENNDTALGIAAAGATDLQFKVDISLTATQVD